MVLILPKHRVAQVSPALPGSNRLVARSSGLCGGNCVVLPLAENPQSCSEHPLGSLPLFLSLLPSLRSSLAASFLNLSLPLLSSASTIPSPHASTSSPPVWLRSSVSPSVPPCIRALPDRRRDSSGARQTLPQVLDYLIYSNVSSLYCTGCGRSDTAGLTCIARGHYACALCFYWEIDIITMPKRGSSDNEHIPSLCLKVRLE